MLSGSTNRPPTNVGPCAVACSLYSDCDTFVSDSVHSVSADGETTLINTRLAAKRLATLKLENFRYSPRLSSLTTGSTNPQSSTEQYVASRTLNLSFSELSYSVKTGIKRGRFQKQYLCPKCKCLPSTEHRAQFRRAGTLSHVKLRRFHNKIAKVYSFEYIVIPKEFFTAHHVGHCCTVIRSHGCALGHSCTNAILGPCATLFYDNDLSLHCYSVFQQWPWSCKLPTPVGGINAETDRQTDTDGPIMCSSLTLERAEHLKKSKQLTYFNGEDYLYNIQVLAGWLVGWWSFF
jgi:hypothetical protein